MNSFFKLKENNTTVGTEIRAGLTTFVAMAYIIFLNPIFLSQAGMDADAVMISTCISAAVGTLLCAFMSNRPFALAAGMGLNTFFAYTLCGTYGYSWNEALALTLIGGVIFLIVAATPLRRIIIEAFPDNLKHAIASGIGLFLAVIGLLDAGIIDMSSGLPALGDISSPAVITALAGLLITILLVVLKVKGSLIIGMIATVVISLVTGQTALPSHIISIPSALGQVAFKLDFSGIISSEKTAVGGIVSFAALLLSLAIVDMFDTLGFMIGIDTNTHILKDDKTKKGVLVADALATVTGAILGCSTVTCFAESSSGIKEGGRTGLTSVVTGICFILAMFFSPIAGLFTSATAAPVLIVVGMYMVADIKNVNFANPDDAIPAYLTLIAIPLAYSISSGIGVGFISHVICKIAARKWNELNVPVIVLAAVFLVYFILS